MQNALLWIFWKVWVYCWLISVAHLWYLQATKRISSHLLSKLFHQHLFTSCLQWILLSVVASVYSAYLNVVFLHVMFSEDGVVVSISSAFVWCKKNYEWYSWWMISLAFLGISVLSYQYISKVFMFPVWFCRAMTKMSVLEKR